MDPNGVCQEKCEPMTKEKEKCHYIYMCMCEIMLLTKLLFFTNKKLKKLHIYHIFPAPNKILLSF
jgi:hypothetical protein